MIPATTVFRYRWPRAATAPWPCAHAADCFDCAECRMGWALVGLGIWCFLRWVVERNFLIETYMDGFEMQQALAGMYSRTTR